MIAQPFARELLVFIRQETHHVVGAKKLHRWDPWFLVSHGEVAPKDSYREHRRLWPALTVSIQQA